MRFFSHIALAVGLLILSNACLAQTPSPFEPGSRVRYNMQIDIRNAYISGVCVMANEDGVIKNVVVNEFGISLMQFVYNPSTKKIKIIDIAHKMNRWYIKRVLKKDLACVMEQLRSGDAAYENAKHNIRYRFNMIKTNDEYGAEE